MNFDRNTVVTTALGIIHTTMALGNVKFLFSDASLSLSPLVQELNIQP